MFNLKFFKGGIAKQAENRQQLLTSRSYNEIKHLIYNRVVAEIHSHSVATANNTLPKREGIQFVKRMCEAVMDQAGFQEPAEREQITNEMINEILGLGPLERFISDKSVTEIMVNGPDNIYVETAGQLRKTREVFRDKAHVMQVIERIVAPIGRRIDESSPFVDARLPDGSRVNAIIPPLSLNGPCLSIRKFSHNMLSTDELLVNRSLTKNMLYFLKACVQGRMNMLVSGGTGSGKTTTLNILSSFIPPNERIITIEDAAELKLNQEHVVRLETRNSNIEGKGEVTVRDLVRNALRMRPDRIIVGEVRGGETIDMLQAMNTGHSGSMATLHANSPQDAVRRTELMAMMAGLDLPVRVIREYITSVIDVIIHQERLADGTRKITRITEVVNYERGRTVLQDIFAFERAGKEANGTINGRFRTLNKMPQLTNKLLQAGICLPEEVFASEAEEVD